MGDEISHAIGRLPFLLGELLDWPAAVYPDKIAMEDETRSLTYAALLEEVLRLGRRFSEKPFGRQQRWGINIDDPIGLIPLLLALTRVGCVGAPFRKGQPTERLRDLFDQNEFTGVIVARESSAAAKLGTFPDLHSVSVDKNSVAFYRHLGNSNQCGDSWALRSVIDLDPALIMWSSGSTRSSRGAVFQHHAVLANIWANIKALGYRDCDRTLLVLPLAHAYGLIHQCLCHLAIGGTVSIPSSPLTPPMLVRALDRFKTTTMATVPPILELLVSGIERLGRVPATLRLVTVGAARARAACIEKLQKEMPHIQLAITYGLTEAGPRVSTNFLKPGLPDTHCVGFPLPNTEIVIRSSHGGQQEICVRSRSAMQSYSDLSSQAETAGTLPTGDYGELRDGQLHVYGRLRRAVNRGGLTIPVEAIEEVLGSCPGVKLAIVEAAPHPFWGEVPIATVYLDGSTGSVTARDLQDLCARRLPEPERPAQIIISNEREPGPRPKEEHLLSAVVGR